MSNQPVMDLGTLVGMGFNILAIIISIWIAYQKADQKLEKILSRDYQGLMTLPQAEALADLYIAEMRREIRINVDEFCDNRLAKILEDPDASSVQLRLKDAAIGRFSRLRRNVAHQFSSFRINPTMTFDHFVEDVDRTGVEKATENIAAMIVRYIESEKKSPISALKEQLSAIANEANQTGLVLIKEKLRATYRGMN